MTTLDLSYVLSTTNLQPKQSGAHPVSAYNLLKLNTTRIGCLRTGSRTCESRTISLQGVLLRIGVVVGNKLARIPMLVYNSKQRKMPR